MLECGHAVHLHGFYTTASVEFRHGTAFFCTPFANWRPDGVTYRDFSETVEIGFERCLREQKQSGASVEDVDVRVACACRVCARTSLFD